ncbi:MAG: hypothetical protein JNJ70_23875 [Verrucomicrobiales bacterium]|nr:hypothetical protein [Verrucomicrobiales bacterium]
MTESGGSGEHSPHENPTDMQINFDKARKLINELEEKLNDTSAHTAAARKALDEWIQSGEAGLRKKGASALKQVRRRADSFTKALTKLEQNLAASLEKMSDSLEKKASKKGDKKVSDKKAPKKKKAAASKKAGKAETPAAKKTTQKAATKKKAAAKKG